VGESGFAMLAEYEAAAAWALVIFIIPKILATTAQRFALLIASKVQHPPHDWRGEKISEDSMADPKSMSMAELKKRLAEVRANNIHPKHPDRLSLLVEIRQRLVASLSASDLHWYTVTLTKNYSTAPAVFQIDVCSPVQKSGFFVPVTADETWKLAADSDYQFLPLTRAVSDQILNRSVIKKSFVEHMPMKIETHAHAFDDYTDKLMATKYKNSGSLVSGSHKVWLTSTKNDKTHTANYGFYHQGKRPAYAQGSPGPYLFTSYSIINGWIKSHHPWNYWDYSQLLQLMKNFRWKGKAYDMKKLILQRNLSDIERTILLPVLWDEKVGDKLLPVTKLGRP
jgi:hypothetical protein